MYAPARPNRMDRSIFLFRPDGWFGLTAFFLPLLTSWPRLSAGAWANGQAEWVLGASTLGVVRFPGYPLYLLIVKLLATALPLGAELWRYHFLSLLFGAGSCLFLYLIARRLLFPSLVSLATALSYFWFYPVWQASLQAGPLAFHFWLLTACVYSTLCLLLPDQPRPLSGWTVAGWAALCGAAAAQTTGLLFWTLACLLLGLLLALPHRRAHGWMYGLAVVSCLLGGLLPYLYLPLRLAATGPHFVNTDFFSPLSSGLTWQGLLGWGKQAWSHWTETPALNRPWEYIWQLWLQRFPILSWALAGFGLITNLRRLFLKTPLRVTEEINLLGRQLLALLTLMALAGHLFFPHQQRADVVLGLALAGPLLGLEALQYALAVLGQGDHRLGLGVRLKPTWAGMCLVLILPLLSLLQGWPESRKTGQQATELAEVRRCLSALPQGGVVVFPDVDQALLPLLLQTRQGLRPDVTLQPLSKPWPESPAGKPSLAQWNRALSQRLSAGKPVMALAGPRKPSPAWDYFLQSFQLLPHPAGGFSAAGQRVFAYEVRPLPLPQSGPASGAALQPPSDLSGPMRLLAAEALSPADEPGAVLTLSLRWQFKTDALSANRDARWLVHFWIQPPAAGLSLPTWKATRRLGYWPPPSWAFAPGSLEEQYQLAVPPDLPAGRYQVKLKVAPQPNARRPRSSLQVTRTIRYLPACEFVVVDPGSAIPSSNRPIAVPGK